MYSILMDTETKCFYMEPRVVEFTAFSSPSKCTGKPKTARLIETEYTDRKEFTTVLYNAGFQSGTIDGEKVVLNNSDAYFYARNNNEILYAQYLLTKDERYLHSINKKLLITVCRIEDEMSYFPGVEIDDGGFAVLAYTDRTRIPQILFDKYEGYKTVKMSFNARALVNGKFVAE